MTPPLLSAIAAIVCSAASLLYWSRAGAQSAPLRTPPQGFTECRLDDVEGPVWCGRVRVPESRDTRSGRPIDLRVITLVATGRAPLRDPIVWLAGGPGVPATKDVADWQNSPLRVERDIVLIDVRGTGGSNPLDCDLFDRADRDHRGVLRLLGPDVYPRAGVRRCRAALAPTADLRQYHTTYIADDLDDVRAALGYDRLNLIGGSFGTRAALVYLRRHPQHVRTLMLLGVVAPYQKIPLNFAPDAQSALEGLATECAADSDCHRHFPDVLADVRAAMARARGGANAEVGDPESGARVRVPVSPGLASETIRGMLYTVAGSSELPARVHAAARGDFAPLVERALRSRIGVASHGLQFGLYFSVTCAEDLPWVDPGAGARAAAGTFLGTSRLRQQLEVCAEWPRGDVPADFGGRIRSKVPALLMSGAFDPVTPPRQAVEVARDLPNARFLRVPSAGHELPIPTAGGDPDLAGTDCIQRLEIEFIRRGTAADLDTSCTRGVHRRGFKTALQVSASPGPH